MGEFWEIPPRRRPCAWCAVGSGAVLLREKLVSWLVMMVGAPRKGEMMAVADLWDVAMLRFYGGVGGDVSDLWWLHVVISEKTRFWRF